MPLVQTFECRLCGAEAGRVELYAAGEPGLPRDHDPFGLDAMSLSRDMDRPRLASFSGFASVIGPLASDLDRVRDAVRAAAAREIYQVDPELVPFWCPTCAAPYCAAHWSAWDLFDEGFFDEKRGRCPKGHERRLFD